MINIQLNERQLKIIDIVKEEEPITSENIATKLNVTRATLRSDLAILTMTGILDARPKVGYFYSGEGDIFAINNNVKDIKVSDIMSVPVLTKQNESTYDVIVNMFLSDVGSVVIIDNDEYLCGVASRKDLLKATLGGTDINKMPIGMIMTRTPNIITLFEDDDVITAANKIIKHEIDSLPVVTFEHGDESKMKVIGRISKTNITRLFVEVFEN